MQIQSLKLFLTDEDIAQMLQPMLEEQEGLQDLTLHLLPEGLQIKGTYAASFGFTMPFETLWELLARGPALEVRLSSIRVAGLPANLLRGALLRMIRDEVAAHPGVTLVEESIRIDVVEAARAQGVDLKIQFTRVTQSIGSLVVEAG